MDKKKNTLDLMKIDYNLTENQTNLLGNSVPAGFPSEAFNYIEDTIDFNRYLLKNKEATYVIKAEGNSMIDAGIFDGDFLIVDRSLDPYDGCIAICYYNQEFLVKKLIYKNNRITHLQPMNEIFKPIVIKEEDQILVWGIVTYSIRNHKK